MDKETYERKRKQILARARKRLHRLRQEASDPESFPLIDVKGLERWIKRERDRELLLLKHQCEGFKIDLDPNQSTFDEMEDFFKVHSGDHRLWANIHGYEPKSLKSEYVEFDSKSGKLVHAPVCVRCGRRLVNGECPVCSKKTDDWLRIG